MSVTPPDNIGGDPGVQQVQPSTPNTPFQPTVPIVETADASAAPPADVAAISDPGRVLAREAVEETLNQQLIGRNTTDAAASAYLAALQTTNRTSVLEFLRTLQNYDNTQAVQKYLTYLDVYIKYGSTPPPLRIALTPASERPSANSPQGLNGPFDYVNIPRETRDTMIQAVDNWVAGAGVFSPPLLDYGTSDGFRFQILDQQTEMARRDADILATNDREKIALYLREMAKLTPIQFMFYDPTGLDFLDLIRRRDFLNAVDELLAEPVPQVRASEMVYEFDIDGSVNFDILGYEATELQNRVEQILNHGNRDKDRDIVELIHRYGREIAGAKKSMGETETTPTAPHISRRWLRPDS